MVVAVAVIAVVVVALVVVTAFVAVVVVVNEPAVTVIQGIIVERQVLGIKRQIVHVLHSVATALRRIIRQPPRRRVHFPCTLPVEE